MIMNLKNHILNISLKGSFFAAEVQVLSLPTPPVTQDPSSERTPLGSDHSLCCEILGQVLSGREGFVHVDRYKILE